MLDKSFVYLRDPKKKPMKRASVILIITIGDPACGSYCSMIVVHTWRMVEAVVH